MSNIQWKDNLGVLINLKNENDKDGVAASIESISDTRWSHHDMKSSNMVKIWEDFIKARTSKVI